MKKRIMIVDILVIIFVSSIIIILSIDGKQKQSYPHKTYLVYLDGKKIGAVISKSSLENYIDSQEEKIKDRFSVNKVYVPKGVKIEESYTYDNDINSNQEIYMKLLKSRNFTIKGYEIKITNPEKEDYKDKTIYVLDKKIFDNALVSLVKNFVTEEKYDLFMEGKQEEIKEYGSIIENIDIEDTITYKEEYISVDENIFIDEKKLTQYMLYGSNKEQETYIVKEGDTIEDVANANKLNVQEFLIANPSFNSENNLLYATQKVIVGLINPIINVVVDVHSIEEVEKAYTTEIKYDENIIKGVEEVEREGENGLDKVTKKYQYINGQLLDAVTISSSNIKPAVNRVVVKGEKIVPSVADLSYWAWPTDYPYTITTYFAYRWGSFHSAIDIYVGYGSGIYAANNGIVEVAKTNCSPGNSGCNGGQGNYIVINHNAGGYYTHYLHLATINVSQGATVARGQKIGTMGNTGYVVPSPSSYSPYSGTHLDFGVRVGSSYNGGKPINPLGLY